MIIMIITQAITHDSKTMKNTDRTLVCVTNIDSLSIAPLDLVRTIPTTARMARIVPFHQKPSKLGRGWSISPKDY